MIYVWAIGSVVLVSLLSLLMIIPFLVKKNVPRGLLVGLLSLSVGTLLATVFVHFLPEIAEGGYTLVSALFILGGFLAFFLLEKLVHHHHHHTHKHHDHSSEGDAHGHAYHLAPINLIGDGVHNFLDGLVIAGAYLVSVPVGIAATIAIIMHEIPQELGDVGILLYAGLNKKKVLFFNLLSAITAILGAVIGLVLSQYIEGLHMFIIPFAAGNFLYIAAANLVPELHQHCNVKETLLHIFFILVGVGIMVGLSFVGLAH